MRSIIAFITGGLFGSGLLISGMTDTTKVRGWLDIFGDWDPTLAFVMGGAIIPMAIAWILTRERKPVLADSFPDTSDTRLSKELIIGSILFGMGWGLSGLCPGPAMASLSFGGMTGLGFFAAMLVGMLLAPRARAALLRGQAS
jgi:hypothetical protein